MNAGLPGAGIRANVPPAMDRLKNAAQRNQKLQMLAQTRQEQAESAEAAGASPCMVEKLRNGEAGNYQMDHPLDVKWGGPPGGPAAPVTLIPLDPVVNGAFGSFAQHIGDKMSGRAPPITQVQSFSLICPPSSPGCPNQDQSTGPRGQQPFPADRHPAHITRVDNVSLGSFLVLP